MMRRRRSKPGHSFADAARGVRIQKVIADAGVASRREAEQMIEAGRVTVNGEVVSALPAWVDPARDRIAIDGKPMQRAQEHVFVMLHKPGGSLVTRSDPEGRASVLALVDHPSGARLNPVGRLDVDAIGLVLLTNDGELINRLTHPRYEIGKEYEVLVRSDVQVADLPHIEEALFGAASGKSAEGGQLSHVRILRREGERTLLAIEVNEPRRRSLRDALAEIGRPVKRIKRTRIGPLQLRGLAVGEWRDLTSSELAQLRAAAFADTATIRQRRERALHALDRTARETRSAQRIVRAPGGKRDFRASNAKPRGQRARFRDRQR
jgi:23S rRNA pseudouridine2605 synthase